MFFKYPYTILLILFCNIYAFTQNNYFYDVEKAQLDSLIYYYTHGTPKKAYHKAHYLLKTLKTNRGIANTNALLSQYHSSQSEIDSSLYYAEQILNYKIVGNDSLNNLFTVKSYELSALAYKKKGLLLESHKWFLKALELCKKYKTTETYYRILHGLGASYISLDKPKNALELFEQCIKHAEDSEIILGSYINLGSIYGSLSNYDKSNYYLKKAKALCISTNNMNALAYVVLNIGDNFSEKGEKNEALLKYYELKKIAFENNLYNLELIASSKIGEVLFNQNKDDDAFLIYTEALYKAIKQESLNMQMSCYLMLEKLSSRKKDFKNAYSYRKNYDKIKDSINDLQVKEEIHSLEVKFKTLEKEKAIKLLKAESINKSLSIKHKNATIEKFKLQESIIAKQNENKFLQLQNGVEKRKNEIILLKEKEKLKALELNRQKTIQFVVLIAFVILLLPIIGLLIIYYQKLQTQNLLHQKEKEINEERVSSLEKDQELKLIKASIQGQYQERKKIAQEMHDSIGGNLAAIKLQFSQLSNNPKKLDLIYSQLDDTYEQVRNLSHNLLPKKIRETEFLILIKEYIKTVEETGELRFNATFFPENELNNLDKTIQNELFAIFQELTTNTIKHAKATTIDLQLDLLNNNIFFVYEDDGLGFNMTNTPFGIGLINIKNRVKNYNGVFNINASPQRGINVNIELPIITKDDET